ncbi:hypothetical protein KQX54_014699 [Cotesia glomerata]|uniref:Uncharacterized protein n=1 Tax=Cotesia glomerata TaxID=32391 RepID=A0AAV7I0Z8_COTGL|nr:hypothetical protein KQX54_014699 [Cotesia glomerata]
MSNSCDDTEGSKLSQQSTEVPKAFAFNPPEAISSSSITEESDKASNLNPNASEFIYFFTDHIPALQQSDRQTPKKTSRGRRPKAELLKDQRTSSLGNITDYLQRGSLKRTREEPTVSCAPQDRSAPPSKVSRSSSSSPPTKHHKYPKMFGTLTDSTKTGNDTQTPATQQPSTIQDLFIQMQSWRAEDRFYYSTYFSTMKDELAGKIAASSKACSEDIAKLRGELNADNAAIRKELETVKLRVADLESNTLPADGSKTTARELEKHMVAASINAVEKHIRRNNIIIRGLSCTESNIKEAVSEFLDKHFKISNGIVEATFPNKTKDAIKVVIKDLDTKLKILKNKKDLKIPDLTPEESFIAKKLRDEGKRLKTEGAKVRQGFQKIFVNGSPMTWSSDSNSLVPCLSRNKPTASSIMTELSSKLNSAQPYTSTSQVNTLSQSSTI